MSRVNGGGVFPAQAEIWFLLYSCRESDNNYLVSDCRMEKNIEGILPCGQKDFIKDFEQVVCTVLLSTVSGQELKGPLNKASQPRVSTSGGSIFKSVC
jgi:hypothetical protein